MSNFKHLQYGLRLSIIISLLLLLSSCHHKDNLLTGKYQPQLNPHPKYFFTVQGYVAPELINHIKVGWRITYIGANDKCDYVANSFEGINASRSVTVYYHPKPNSSGHYQIKIPLDKYSSGYCHWQACTVETNYGTEDLDGYSTMTQYCPCGTDKRCDQIKYVKENKYRTHNSSTGDCYLKPDGSLICKWRPLLSFSPTSVVPKNKSYFFLERYFYKG